MNEGRCNERLKARVEESTCLTYTGLHDRASARSRHDDNPTDTLGHTQNRNPRQGAADHCLMSERRRCSEEVAIATVLLRELHS
jgi:hypothetical protein